jgi:hypothetical protein
MRLLRILDTGDLSLISLDKDDIVDVTKYEALSYVWGADTEKVTFGDLTNGTGKDKPGYENIRLCAEQASRDGLGYYWVDTCCIDKQNQAELLLAIASMFRWYQNANQCYAYLSDLSTTERNVSGQFTWKPAFQGSGWLARAWILQESLSLDSVESFSPKVERLKAKFQLQYLLDYLLPVVSAREESIGLLDASRLSEDGFMLGLDTKFQTTETEFDVLFGAIRGRRRRWTYEESIKNGQYARELRQEGKQGLVYHETIALGRSATKRDEIGANCGLGCQHIRMHGLCTFQNVRADSTNQPKLMSQYYRDAVYTPDRFCSRIEEARVAKNLPCFMNFTKSGSDGESVAVQDTSPFNMKGSPAINVQDPSKIHQHPTYSAPQYAYQAPQLPLPHRFHIAPTCGGIGDIPFVLGAEEQCVVDSNVICSTALSDKTSVFSQSSENDPAAGTEISNHYNSAASILQYWNEVLLLQMGQILPVNAHEFRGPEMRNNGPVTPGIEDSHLSADGREDSGYGDQELPTLGKDTAHLEEAILANYETSALRDFVDDPSHQYWTWCKEYQNWWHKDEKSNAIIWAPLDFD